MRVHEDALNRKFFFVLVTLRLFLQNKVGKIYLYFGAFLLKHYSTRARWIWMIIANSTLRATLAIHHLICNKCLRNSEKYLK